MKKYQEAFLIAKNLFDMVDIYNKEQKRDFLKVENNFRDYSGMIEKTITSNTITEFVLTSGSNSESLAIIYKGEMYKLSVEFLNECKEIDTHISITHGFYNGLNYNDCYCPIKINKFIYVLKEIRDNYIKMFTDKEAIKKYSDIEIN